MTLPELCEPLFHYVMRLSRSARKGSAHQMAVVRSEVKAQLAEIRSRAEQDVNVAGSFEKIELALVFFVDFMIRASSLPFALDWKDLALEQGELAGDEKFHVLLNETLKDPSKAAAERLAVFYTCMGLGFTGAPGGIPAEPEYLRKKMAECAARLRDIMDVEAVARLCPDAYVVNTINMTQPPGKWLLGISIALVGLIVVLLVANFCLYRQTVGKLAADLSKILEHDTAAAPASPAADERR
jgi:type VI protein secretion system component VasF